MIHRYLPLHLALVTFILSLTIYLLTLAPTVTFVDSGELAAVVATDGISHPSGSPLYLLLGSLAAAIPAGSLIVRLNALSAFCAAASVAFTFVVFFIAGAAQDVKIDRQFPKKQKAGKKKKGEMVKTGVSNAVVTAIDRKLIYAGAIASALSWMTSRTFWSTATVTEVYAPNLLFLTLLTLLLILYVRASLSGQGSVASRRLAAATLVTGLAMSNYPPFGIFIVVVLFVVYRVERAGLWKRWRRNAVMVGIFVFGLLPYLALPMRASSDPLINWGNPSNWRNFWAHITAEQYRIFLTSPDLAVLKRIVPLWIEQWPMPLWLLCIPGLVVLWRWKPFWFYFTMVAVSVNLAYGLTYNISDVASAPSDFENYFLPLFWISSVWMGAGICCLIHRLNLWKIPIPWVLCLLPLTALATNWKESDRSHYTYAEDFVRSVLDNVAPNALILTPDWTFVAPAMYLQHVENLRPDAVVYDGELLRRSWYFGYVKKTAPWLYDATRPSIDAFLVELAKYDNKQPYDPKLTTRKYIAMLNHFLIASYRLNHPPYILLNLEMKEAALENYRKTERSLGRPPYFTVGVPPHLIGGRFQWVPETPAFRLYPPDQSVVLPEVRIPRGQFGPDQYYDNVTKGVIVRYADFWRWRGDYLQKHRDCAAAKLAYQKALAIEQKLPEAMEGLRACR